MANAMLLANRITLLKALVPGIASEMTPRDFEGLMVELCLKGEGFYDAVNHPSQSRKSRHVTGERDIEER